MSPCQFTASLPDWFARSNTQTEAVCKEGCSRCGGPAVGTLGPFDGPRKPFCENCYEAVLHDQ